MRPSTRQRIRYLSRASDLSLPRHPRKGPEKAYLSTMLGSRGNQHDLGHMQGIITILLYDVRAASWESWIYGADPPDTCDPAAPHGEASRALLPTVAARRPVVE